VDAPVFGAYAGGVAAVITTIGAVGYWIGKPMRRLAKSWADFSEDWYGQAARPGHDPQPGVMERLQRIETELRSNGGSTLRDAVVRLEQSHRTFDGRLSNIESRLPPGSA
jgi:hypothetical protein